VLAGSRLSQCTFIYVFTQICVGIKLKASLTDTAERAESVFTLGILGAHLSAVPVAFIHIFAFVARPTVELQTFRTQADERSRTIGTGHVRISTVMCIRRAFVNVFASGSMCVTLVSTSAIDLSPTDERSWCVNTDLIRTTWTLVLTSVLSSFFALIYINASSS
jgi:hypothetical protein